jgi:putative MATE family efflux protein
MPKSRFFLQVNFMPKIYDLTRGSIFKKILTIALPVLLTSISQMAYNLTDMFWIGKVDDIGFSESDALSSIGTAGYILWFAFGIILIAKIGTSVKVSHHAGRNDLEGIRRYASNGIFLEMVFGLLVSGLILVLRHPLIGIFDLQSQTIYDQAILYLSITGGSIVLVFVTNGFSAIYEGLGKTLVNLLILPIGLILNMILDPLMILTWRMGVIGAAWATVISQAVTLSVYVIVYFCSKSKVFSFRGGALQPKISKEILQIGLPTGLQSMLFTTCSIVIGVIVLDFGDGVFAAQRLGSQIEQLTWMIAGGFQTALTVFVGQNYGAKNLGRIRKGTGLLSAILIPYSAIITIIFVLKPGVLIGLFVDNDLETLAYAEEYLRILSFSQMFMMVEGIGAGLFNGMGMTKIPSAAGIIGNIMRIPLALWLSAVWAQRGIWWSLNFSDGLKGTFLLLGGIYTLIHLESIIFKKEQSKKTMMNELISEPK